MHIFVARYSSIRIVNVLRVNSLVSPRDAVRN